MTPEEVGGTSLGLVHRYVPPAAGAGRVTLLLLHGTGGDEHDLLPLGRVLLPGAGMLSPRGQVWERGAYRFFRRFAEGVFDLEDLAHRGVGGVRRGGGAYLRVRPGGGIKPLVTERTGGAHAVSHLVMCVSR